MILNKIICLTPVRNEAWILRAFLTATSLWADIIIISDQGSTDGSREIALSFPKVILVDNPARDMNQAQTRKLLFDEAQKISGQKVLFSLDADEFLSGDFVHTASWQKILLAQPGDIFFFRWINVCEQTDKCIITTPWMNWASCIENTDDTIFPDAYIHEWRLPYPAIGAREIKVEDIFFIHLARVNVNRQANKNRFYQVVTRYKEPDKSIVSLYRMYHSEDVEEKSTTDSVIYSYYEQRGLYLLEMIDLNDSGKYYTDQVLDYFNKMGTDFFYGLDIWDFEFCKQQHIDYKPSFKIRILFYYLKITQQYRLSYFVKMIDKVLQKAVN
ncbi:MAG: hypothetical protein RIS29_649 [Bacteroidota bacterium]|jgi:hypothetical protein